MYHVYLYYEVRSSIERQKRIVLCLLQYKAVSMLVCKSHLLLCVGGIHPETVVHPK
jgi:hypothetical protein